MAKAVIPGWSFSTASITIIETNHAAFELRRGKETLAVCYSPEPLLRYAYIHKLLQVNEIAELADKFGLKMKNIILE